MSSDTPTKVAALLCGVLILAALIFVVESRGSSSIRQSMIKDVAALGGEVSDRPALPDGLVTRDGKPLDLTQYRGRVVFLNFWASWCPPCREEMPSMEQLARKFAGRGLVMIAATQDDDRQAMDAFLSQVMPDGKLQMQIAFDRDGVVARRYGTRLLPETYIIDPEGQIVARFVNKYDWTRPEVERFIERLLLRSARMEG